MPCLGMFQSESQTLPHPLCGNFSPYGCSSAIGQSCTTSAAVVLPFAVCLRFVGVPLVRLLSARLGGSPLPLCGGGCSLRMYRQTKSRKSANAGKLAKLFFCKISCKVGGCRFPLGGGFGSVRLSVALWAALCGSFCGKGKRYRQKLLTALGGSVALWLCFYNLKSFAICVYGIQ